MGIRNIRLTIEYDGTRYYGWQFPKKENSATISGKISGVLRRMTEEDVTLFCGEKTDTGVHAFQQTVNFRTSSRMKETEIRQYLNQYLPPDIAVREVTEVSERFHAELNPHMTTYQYCMLIGDTEDVFRYKYVDFRTEMPDIEKMRRAAEQMKGRHDFKVFSAGKTKKSTMREVADLQILNMSLEDQPLNCQSSDKTIWRTGLGEDEFFQTVGCNIEYKEIYIMIRANGFLKQMPQKIIGTLLDIGYGKREYSCIESIFEGKEPASSDCADHALFLQEVKY